MNNKDVKNIIKKLVIATIWLIIWQIVAICVNNSIFFASPVAVCKSLVSLMHTKNYYFSIFNSLVRILAGFTASFIIGFIFAFLAYEIEIIKDFIYPLILLLRSVPVAAVVVIISMVAGSDMLSFYVTFMVSFPLVYQNIIEGLTKQDKKMLELAKVYRLNFLSRFINIYLPNVYSHISGAIKTGLGMSFKSGVAAEIIVMTKDSIGLGIYNSKIYLDTKEVLAWTLSVVIISYFTEKIILLLFAFFNANKNNHTIIDEVKNISTLEANSCTVPLIKEFKDKYFKQLKSEGAVASLNGVSKAFDDKEILTNINLEIASGKSYCICADSGKGKTTLIKIIAGLENADGLIIKPDNISMVFQENRLFENKTVMHNLRAFNNKIVSEDIEKLLLAAGLDGVMDKTISELSGGMKRRVSIIAALINKSDMLIFDEAFSGLDMANANLMNYMIKELAFGRTLIFTSHSKLLDDYFSYEYIEL